MRFCGPKGLHTEVQDLGMRIEAGGIGLANLAADLGFLASSKDEAGHVGEFSAKAR